MTPPTRKAGLKDVVRWVIGTLIGLAQSKGYGVIRITVQAGQIEFVHLDQSWNMNTLPMPAGGGPDLVTEVLSRRPPV